MRLHTNRSNHLDPSNEDRTHDLSTVDPHVRCGRSGRAPPSRARRLRSRRGGRSSTSRFSRLDLREGEREGAALRGWSNLNCVEGVPPSPLFIGGGGGEVPLEEGAALGLRPRVSSSLVLRQGGVGKLPGSSPRRPPLLGPYGPCAPSPLGPSK